MRPLLTLLTTTDEENVSIASQNIWDFCCRTTLFFLLLVCHCTSVVLSPIQFFSQPLYVISKSMPCKGVFPTFFVILLSISSTISSGKMTYLIQQISNHTFLFYHALLIFYAKYESSHSNLISERCCKLLNLISTYGVPWVQWKWAPILAMTVYW